jgi:thioredoxin-related protein
MVYEMESKDKNLKILTLIIAIFLVSIGILLIIPSETEAGDTKIEWYNYEEGMALANTENKNVMLYFHTDWCSWCRRMDADTFSHGNVVDKAQDFIPIRVDGDDRRDLVDKYKVDGYPTVIFLNSTGSTTNKVVGYQNPTQFLASMGGENSVEDGFVCSLTDSWANLFMLIMLPIALIIILMILDRRKNQLSARKEKSEKNDQK